MIKTTLCVLFCLIGFSSIGQDYIPFPKDSATWSYYETLVFVGGMGGASCRTDHYGLYGDTIIDSVIYSKLYKNSSEKDSSFNLSSSYFIGGIREDSSRKVWLRQPTDSVDQLLMDFKLKVGDTLSHVVVKIDSVKIDGNFRRRFLFDPGSEWFSAIEGIGFTNTFFGLGPSIDIELVLGCFEVKGQLKYEDTDSFTTGYFKILPGTCHCNLSTGIEKLTIINDLLLFPNPVIQSFSIKSEHQIIRNTTIDIYSSDGRKVLSLPYNAEINKIDVSTLDPGLYFVRLQNQHEEWRARFVKMMP